MTVNKHACVNFEPNFQQTQRTWLLPQSAKIRLIIWKPLALNAIDSATLRLPILFYASSAVQVQRGAGMQEYKLSKPNRNQHVKQHTLI